MPSSAESKLAQQDQIRLLLIEDDPQALAMMSDAILASPLLQLVGTASNLSEAERWLSEAAYDVVLMDLDLHGRSAVPLIREADRRGQAKVIVVTVLGDENTVLSALKAGADGYLLKSSDAFDVQAAVEMVMNGEPPLSPRVARYLLREVQDGEQQNEPANHGLSPREIQMLTALAAGYTYREIAAQHNISYHTVVDYVRSLYRKLAVNSRTEALMTAVREGLITAHQR